MDANRQAERDKILKDIHKVDEDVDSKAKIVHEQVTATGGIHEAQISSNEPAAACTTGVGNEDQPDKEDLKGEMSTCHDADEEKEEVKELNYDKEAMEDLMSKLHIGKLPTIGKSRSTPLNNLRSRGRSTLLLFYRLWRDHLLKKPPPPL